MVQITKNGGGSWNKISNSFPQNLWVSRAIASSHKKERVYVTLNGYRFDDFTSYIYVSEDYGTTWKNIGNTIPTSSVNVIKEDPANKNILYVGTDNGLYVSFDTGNSWQAFSKNLPNVAVHDLVIQPTAKDLIVGTHGRSLYKANIAPLQLLTHQLAQKDIHIFAIKSIRKSKNWGSSWSKWLQPNTPKVSIPFYVNSKKKVTIDVFSGTETNSAKAVKVNSFSVDADRGFNEAIFDVSFSKKGKKAYLKSDKEANLTKAKNDIYYLPKGKYIVKIGDEKGGFEIK